MRTRTRLTALTSIVALLLPAFAPAQDPVTKTVDIAVYGGTASGVIAAVAAKQEGKTVLLIEPGNHLGGMTSGGLGWTDFGNKAAIGGMSLDFYKRVGKAMGSTEAAWHFEPSVAEKVLIELVAEHAVDVVKGHRLFAVDMEGDRIARLTLEHAPPLPNGAPAPARKEGSQPLYVKAKVYLDCTYEGDLLARAGVGYSVGRESAEKYNEPLNGIRAKTPSHQFKNKVSPYVKPGDPASGLVAMVPSANPDDFGEPGEGDHRVQAYNFRLCLTKTEKNKNEIGVPPGYDPARYELLARHVESMVAANQGFSLRSLLKIDMVTKDKTDINNQGAVSTDYIGGNYAYPDADWPTRSKIWSDHVNYVQGLLYFLGHSERIPESVRTDMLGWGFPRDEFQDTGGWPHQLYVREARRMVGRYVITQNDCDHKTTIEDSVGLGAYNMDSHNCQRVIVKDPAGDYVMNEGDVQVSPRGPYKIGYAAITPKQDECENLIVPVAISASHIAYGSARMEPVFMVLGQSGAIAASMAIDAGKPVQQVDVRALQEKLLKAGQVLEPPPKSVRPARAAIEGGSPDPARMGSSTPEPTAT
jgi:hypothetical protein